VLLEPHIRELVTRGQIEAVLEFAAPGAAIEGKLPEIASGGRCGASTALVIVFENLEDLMTIDEVLESSLERQAPLRSPRAIFHQESLR
jgi:hypothetical protein